MKDKAARRKAWPQQTESWRPGTEPRLSTIYNCTQEQLSEAESRKGISGEETQAAAVNSIFSELRGAERARDHMETQGGLKGGKQSICNEIE